MLAVTLIPRLDNTTVALYAYREYCVLVDDKDSHDGKSDRLSTESTKKHVHLQPTTDIQLVDRAPVSGGMGVNDNAGSR